MLEILGSIAQTSNLSPIGIDWWIILGGWVPGFLGLALAFVIWARSRGDGDE
ncbi:MAG: hypothetical protein QFX34_00060 [Candidatus Verstraetearchaeota archaeon]|nr:hypothetical protein [Candidatus Verstraetearchaeota archaeon]